MESISYRPTVADNVFTHYMFIRVYTKRDHMDVVVKPKVANQHGDSPFFVAGS